jgi:DNA polymerase-1
MLLLRTVPTPMLYLVDGDGLLYRAANAIPYFANDHGLPINGLHGFVSMVRILLRQAQPSAMAVAFTADPPLRRHALDRAYKINHYEHPEEIKRQLPYAIRIAEAMGLHAFLEPGLEADDVMVTLLRRAPEAPVRIVSNDRDFYQLVSGRVRILAPVRGVTEMREVGPAEVRAAFGVAPGQVPDLKALTGDASDDIPGVPGIGPKTAAALLRDHVTVERLLDRLDRVPVRLRERLASLRDRILLNKQLAVLRPVAMRSRRVNLRIRRPRQSALAALAEETGVASLAR